MKGPTQNNQQAPPLLKVVVNGSNTSSKKRKMSEMSNEVNTAILPQNLKRRKVNYYFPQTAHELNHQHKDN